MRSRYLACALVALVVGLSGTASAQLVIYDHFDSPTDAINTSLWDVAGTGVSVSDSILTVAPSTGGAWTEVSSKGTFDPMAEQSYEFLYEGGDNQIMGIYGGAGTAYIRNLSATSGQWQMWVSGTDKGAVFSPAPGDRLTMTRTASNWQVYDNDTLVSQSSGLGGFVAGDAAVLFLGSAGSAGGSLALDYVAVGVRPVPEPSVLSLLGAGLVGFMAYAWRKRR